MLNDLIKDVRSGLRSLLRSPGFTMVVVMTLALGMGASTAMFSVVDGVLLKPLSYPEPDRLVLIGLSESGLPPSYTSLPELMDLRDGTTTLEGVAGVQRSSLIISGEGNPERVSTARVTRGFLDLFGMRVALGRSFSPEEYDALEPQVVILSHELWMRRWAGDVSVLGRTIRTDEDRSGAFTLLTVVGILPEGFRPPEALATAAGAEAWLPLPTGPAAYATNRASRSLYIAGRLERGADIGAARRELEALSDDLRATYPTTYENAGGRRGFSAQPLVEATVASSRQMLLMLLGASALLLIIGCANAANLLLARAMERRRELSVRSALGASKARLVRQLLTESLLLATASGVLGALTAAGAVLALRTFEPSEVPRLDSLAVDGRPLAFAAASIVLTGVLFGLAPALFGSTRECATLAGAARGSEGRQALRLRSGLVVAETALAVVLVAGAGLLVNSFRAVANVDPGFVAEGVSYTEIGLPQDYQTDQERARFFATVVDEIAALPGVASAGVVADPPIGYTMWMPRVLLPDAEDGPAPSVPAHLVDGGFFETLGIRITKGRGFTELDGADSPPVAVVNESMARRFWPDGEPVGAQFRRGTNAPWVTVVGVSNDVRQEGLTTAAEPQYYVPFSQNGWFRYMNVVFKTRPGTDVPLEALRQAIHRVDGTIPFEGVTSMQHRISDSLKTRRFVTWLMASFALIALILATGGLYGTQRYAVERRTKEFGIRLAVGGLPASMMVQMVRYGVCLAAGGILVGLPVAVVASRLLDRLLFGVTATDPGTLATASALMLLGAALVAWIPARRVTRVDLVEVLRNE
ncbi:MAG TPA: ABC transporter permease [Longimicrobiales bacterium]|nr:ABC transporter permease [Longimicrobiales bacterium]